MRALQTPILACISLCIACPPRLPAETCDRDSDCPARSRCDPNLSLCVSAAKDAGFGPWDACVLDGKCTDATRHDAARPDTALSDRATTPDAAHVDAAAGDRVPRHDAAIADAGRDAAAESDAAGLDDDAAVPDAARPDSGPQDQHPIDLGLALPDAALVDAALSDSTPEDAAPQLPCQVTGREYICGGFEHFADGYLSSSTNPKTTSMGALYVAADGTLRSVHTTDVNADGFADLPLGAEVQVDASFPLSKLYLGPLGQTQTPQHWPFATTGCTGWVAADLDFDGLVDPLPLNYGEFHHPATLTLLYQGQEQTTPDLWAALTVVGAGHGAAVDFDGNGFLDLAITTRTLDSGNPTEIRFRNAQGFSQALFDLDVNFGGGMMAADFDQDGVLDLAAAEISNQTRLTKILWGNPGWQTYSTTEFQSWYAQDISLADLDEDGHLDVVLAENAIEGDTASGRLQIHWGSGPRAFAAAPRIIDFPKAVRVSIVDLDHDGHLDIVVAHDNNPVGESAVLWGDGTREGLTQKTALATNGARGLEVADYDGDDQLDIAFAEFGVDSNNPSLSSRIYWGNGTRAFSNSTSYEITGASGMREVDYGDLYTREPYEYFESGVIEIPEGHTAATLSWDADTPGKSSISLLLMSGETVQALNSSGAFQGPDGADSWYVSPGQGINQMHGSDRFFRYKVRIHRRDYANLPVLRSVTFGLD